MTVLISIVIPTYRRADRITALLGALGDQIAAAPDAGAVSLYGITPPAVELFYFDLRKGEVLTFSHHYFLEIALLIMKNTGQSLLISRGIFSEMLLGRCGAQPWPGDDNPPWCVIRGGT